jgi:hypothetical protein
MVDHSQGHVGRPFFNVEDAFDSRLVERIRA